jgi:hypothetical protein
MKLCGSRNSINKTVRVGVDTILENCTTDNMPPLMVLENHHPVVSDADMMGLLLGSVEVVDEEIENGRTRIVCKAIEEDDEDDDDDDNIMYMYDNNDVGTFENVPLRASRRSSIFDDIEEDDGDEEEGIEIPESLSYSLLETLLLGCVGCEPCSGPYKQYAPKSILRKRTDGNHPSQPLRDRNVSFSSLQIKEFEMTLGDHPSASSGPPMCIDWQSVPKERVVDLDEYETTRTPRRKRRQLKISYRERKALLEGQKGFSTQQVNEAWAEAIRIRQQRQETIKRGLLLMTIDDAMESVQRKCQRAVESVGLGWIAAPSPVEPSSA